MSQNTDPWAQAVDDYQDMKQRSGQISQVRVQEALMDRAHPAAVLAPLLSLTITETLSQLRRQGAKSCEGMWVQGRLHGKEPYEPKGLHIESAALDELDANRYGDPDWYNPELQDQIDWSDPTVEPWDRIQDSSPAQLYQHALYIVEYMDLWGLSAEACTIGSAKHPADCLLLRDEGLRIIDDEIARLRPRPESTPERSRRIPADVRRAVWRRDQGRCVECDTKERLEFDHIIPFSKGGSNTERNIQLLCERCNRAKGAAL